VRTRIFSKMERIKSDRNILGKWIKHGACLKAIKECHNRLAKKQRKCRVWWRHHLPFNGGKNCANLPCQVASEIKVKDFQYITSRT
jgi:hypothetical protein